MKITKYLVIALIAIPMIVAAKTREEIPEKYKWNLNDIYATPEQFAAAKKNAEQKLAEVEACKGHLGDSAARLKQCLDVVFSIYQEYVRLNAYAMQHYDENLKNLEAQKAKGEVDQLGVIIREKAAWLSPEIQAIGPEKIEAFLKQEEGLSQYRVYLKDTLRSAQHTLSVPEEALLSRAGMVTGTPYQTYGAFTSADMVYPKIKLSDGTEIDLGQAAYTKYRSSENRQDRKVVFEEFFKAYKKNENTLGVLLNSQNQGDWFVAKSRKYGASVEAALFGANIPVQVYKQLVTDINANLSSTLHRYLDLRKRMLKLEKLYYYDMYPSLVKDVNIPFPYDSSKEIILESLKPLGPEYRKALEETFGNRWIDVYPNEGKRQGAYSNGSFYTGHPYVLLNYNDDYESISTLAHELGHNNHSYFSSKTQPFPTSDYAIFVAEVASTFNEILLNEYLLSKETDPEKKLFLLGNLLERARQTIFRQAMFAEFELETHTRVEKGETLTGADFTKLYLDLLRKYHGHDKGITQIDDLYGIEWSYIPHFYYNFYVFQYATGQIAATALAEKVVAKEPGAVDRYLTFLKSGSSEYPIEVLKKAGADLTTSDPFNTAMKSFTRTLDRIEEILKQMESAK